MANMCAGVTSTYMEFTLTFWNLKMHFSLAVKTDCHAYKTEHVFLFADCFHKQKRGEDLGICMGVISVICLSCDRNN